MTNGTIDETDLEILNIIQNNGRIPNAEIARRISMAPSAVLERLRKLERKGVVKGYETRLDPKALGLGLTAFSFVRTEESVGSTDVGEVLAGFPEVMEVHHTAGEDCYLIKVRVADTGSLGSLLKRFGAIPEVRDTRTTIVLTTVKESVSIPLGEIKE